MLKRRCMTLLELLISLGLFSILLTSLLFWYGHLTKQKAMFSHVFPPLLQQHYAYSKIERSLGQVLTVQQPVFFSSQEPDGSTSLVFSFDHGIQSDPMFSGPVLAKLYWNQEGQALQLTIWPFPKHPYEEAPSYSQTHTLLDHVTHCEMKFFAPNTFSHLPVLPQHIGHELPSAGWQPKWLKTYPHCAALVHLHLTRNRPLEWIFDLHLPILYPAEVQ